MVDLVSDRTLSADPGFGVRLIAFTKEESAAAARYGSEDAGLLPIDLETN